MVIDFIKEILDKEARIRREKIKKLQGAPDSRVAEELGQMLYRMSVDLAAIFVQEELSKKDTPFKGLDKYTLFHEMMIVNFWLIDKIFSKYLNTLPERVYNLYSLSFPQAADYLGTVPEKFKAYYNSWDDVTGHHDIFGEKVAEILFGKELLNVERRVSFWIVLYSDKALKTFKRFRNICRDMNVLTYKKTTVGHEQHA